MLPAAMYPVMGPWGTIPSSVLIGFMMFGIEDIGSRIECPWFSLPMWQYADTICDGVVQMREQDAEKITKDRSLQFEGITTPTSPPVITSTAAEAPEAVADTNVTAPPQPAAS